MPSFDRWEDIRLDILDRAEEETGANVSEFYAYVARAGDRAYQDLLSRRPWLFSRARRPLMLQARAPISTTITWTAGLYTATLAAAQSVSLVGWKVRPSAQVQAYRIVAHVPGSASITLEAPLQGGTNLVAAAVTVFKDEYDLAEIQDIPGPVTVALAGAGAGSVDNGAHNYKTTFQGDNGETEPSSAVSVTVADKTVNGKVNVTAIPTGPPGTVGRRLYRTKAGAAVYFLLTTIADNVTTTYTDNTADANLGADQIPDRNTTGRVRHVVGIWSPQHNRPVRGPWPEDRLRNEYPDPPSPSWPPWAFSRITETQIRFSQYPSQAGLLEIPYTSVPKDLSQTVGAHEIVLPREWRWALSDGGLFFLLEQVHDSRAATWGARWEKFIDDLAKEDELKKLGLSHGADGSRQEPAA